MAVSLFSVIHGYILIRFSPDPTKLNTGTARDKCSTLMDARRTLEVVKCQDIWDDICKIKKKNLSGS